MVDDAEDSAGERLVQKRGVSRFGTEAGFCQRKRMIGCKYGEAGRGAGMLTVAAAWGYLDGDDPAQWGADLVAASPQVLMRALRLPA